MNCPASVETLRTLIAEALARRDANAIAGVMRWDGVGGAAARQRMREITELAARPMLGIDASGRRGPVQAAPDAPEDAEIVQPAPPTTLLVRTGSSEDGGSREHEFGIIHSEGCYWLDWYGRAAPRPALVSWRSRRSDVAPWLRPTPIDLAQRRHQAVGRSDHARDGACAALRFVGVRRHPQLRDAATGPRSSA